MQGASDGEPAHAASDKRHARSLMPLPSSFHHVPTPLNSAHATCAVNAEQQLRIIATYASAVGEQADAAKRSVLQAAVTGHRHQLRNFEALRTSLDAGIVRARELIGRQPARQQHHTLLCIDLHLHRHTTHMMIEKASM